MGYHWYLFWLWTGGLKRRTKIFPNLTIHFQPSNKYFFKINPKKRRRITVKNLVWWNDNIAWLSGLKFFLFRLLKWPFYSLTFPFDCESICSKRFINWRRTICVLRLKIIKKISITIAFESWYFINECCIIKITYIYGLCRLVYSM